MYFLYKFIIFVCVNIIILSITKNTNNTNNNIGDILL